MFRFSHPIKKDVIYLLRVWERNKSEPHKGPPDSAVRWAIK